MKQKTKSKNIYIYKDNKYLHKTLIYISEKRGKRGISATTLSV